MSQIILDISANTHKNDFGYYMKMIEELAKIDTHKHEIIIKGQLFEKSAINIVQDKKMFEKMYYWTKKEYGYRVTASVFDKSSLNFLLNFEVPFIKIPCNPDYYWLIGEIPRKIPVYVSVKTEEEGRMTPIGNNIVIMWCVPKYPASMKEYLEIDGWYPADNISDHTVGFELLKELNPLRWEKHLVLEHNDINPDAGLFAVTPEELEEIL